MTRRELASELRWARRNRARFRRLFPGARECAYDELIKELEAAMAKGDV